jgi:hypothetical protein
LRKKNGKAVEQPSSQPASASVSSFIDYLSESSIKDSGKKGEEREETATGR